MIAHLLIALLAQDKPESIAEYFPLHTGDSWVYNETSEFGTVQATDTVGEPVTINGEPASPVVTTSNGKEAARAYYHVGAGEVTLVAFDEKKPMLSAYPILRSPVLGDDWTYKGETQVLGEPADLQLKGRVKKVGAVDFGGKKVDALEVTLEAKMMESFGTPITSVQVATYGRGIGLIRMESSTKLPKRTEKATRQLVSYKPKGS